MTSRFGQVGLAFAIALASALLLSAGTSAVTSAVTPNLLAVDSFGTYGTSDSRAVTVPAATSRFLLFEFAGKNGGDTLGSVTYGGRPLQLLASRDQGSVHVEMVNEPLEVGAGRVPRFVDNAGTRRHAR